MPAGSRPRAGSPAAASAAAKAARVAEDEGRAQGVADLAPEQAVDQRDHRGVAGRPLGRVPDRDDEAAAGPEHAPHLAERRGPVLEEHQAELAHDGVEAAVGERQRLGAALAPVDARLGPPRDREHAALRSSPTTAPDGRSRRAARASTPVPQATSRTRRPGADAGGLGDGTGELREQRRQEEGFVDLGGGRRDLAELGGVHGSPPFAHGGMVAGRGRGGYCRIL